MKVYVVTDCTGMVDLVFSSKKKANKYIDKREGYDIHPRDVI